MNRSRGRVIERGPPDPGCRLIPCNTYVGRKRDARAAVTVTVCKFKDAYSERDDSTDGRDTFKYPWIQSQRSSELT